MEDRLAECRHVTTGGKDNGRCDDVQTREGTARVPGRPFGGLGWRHLDRLHEAGEDTNAVVKEWMGGMAS